MTLTSKEILATLETISLVRLQAGTSWPNFTKSFPEITEAERKLKILYQATQRDVSNEALRS